MPPDAIYTFKHALIQDAAYESLLRTRRTDMHAAIVSALECDSNFGALGPAMLGYHCAQAGLIEKAASYYREAGERSGKLSAFVETKTLLERGLTLAKTLADNPGRRRLQAELLIAHGRVLHVTEGMSNMEAATDLELAIQLSRTLDDTETLARALSDWWINVMWRGGLDAGWPVAQELLRIGVRRDDAQTEVFAQTALGITQLLRGHLTEARKYLAAAGDLRVRKHDTQFDARR